MTEPARTAAPPPYAACMAAALASRRSVRAFLPTPVDRATIAAILQAAARAPSGTNTQPWRVHVLTGEARAALSRKIVAVYDDPVALAAEREAYDYYPTDWVSPYIERRRKIGWDLYGLLGIARGDKARMHAQHRRNFEFFGAPVGLMFTIEDSLRQGSWLDYGMFVQSVMLAARAHGLDTCPQAAFLRFHRIVLEHVGAGIGEQLVCGMSLGHADLAAPENRLVTERAPLSEFARFHER